MADWFVVAPFPTAPYIWTCRMLPLGFCDAEHFGTVCICLRWTGHHTSEFLPDHLVPRHLDQAISFTRLHHHRSSTVSSKTILGIDARCRLLRPRRRAKLSTKEGLVDPGSTILRQRLARYPRQSSPSSIAKMKVAPTRASTGSSKDIPFKSQCPDSST